ncbi:unnamed protein product [Arabidopsis halleri]
MQIERVGKTIIICEIGSGITCSFLKDNWTSLGPLIDLTGVSGPRIIGLPVTAVVADALRDGEWWLTTSRSRNDVIQLTR